MKKSLLVLLFALVLPLNVLAASGLSVDYPDAPKPIFDIPNLVPGQKIEKTVKITNNYDSTRKVGFKIEKPASISPLASVIEIEVKDQNSITKYRNNLFELYDLGELSLDALAPGGSSNYTFIAVLNENAGNEYQSLKETFDFSLGFIETDDTNINSSSSQSFQIGRASCRERV